MNKKNEWENFYRKLEPIKKNQMDTVNQFFLKDLK